ncbi:MAG: hypothetical protein II814_01935 [Treponema sp.]|nr:hypothetical protein [Treponema sp.]
MSDAAFYAMLGQIDEFSLPQKKTLIKALKKSVAGSFFKTKTRKDLHLLESLVGVAGSENISISQIKSERLSEK